MQFIEITQDNFLKAIDLRPKRSQYRFMRRDAVLYSIGRAYTATRDGEAIPLVIEDNGKLVGAIRLRNYGRGVGFAAFFIDRKHQRKGYAKRALQYLVDYIETHFPDAGEIELCVLPDNTAGRRLFESAGYRYTGVVNPDGTLDMEVLLD